jgi:hypothetical protein
MVMEIVTIKLATLPAIMVVRFESPHDDGTFADMGVPVEDALEVDSDEGMTGALRGRESSQDRARGSL